MIHSDTCVQVQAPAQQSTASNMSQPAAQAQQSLAALGRLRRQLRQLDPGLSVAPPPLLFPSQSTVAAAAGGSDAAPVVLPSPLPLRLTSRDGIEDALSQLQRHQQQARALQVGRHCAIQRRSYTPVSCICHRCCRMCHLRVLLVTSLHARWLMKRWLFDAQSAAGGRQEDAAAKKADLVSLTDRTTGRQEELRRAPSETSSSASNGSRRTPSTAASTRSTGLSAQLQRLRLLQGQGAALVGAVAAQT